MKCADSDPDVVNDGVASSMTSDSRSAVFWSDDGGHCRVGIAERTLVAEASDDKGFAGLCHPASGTAMTGPRESDAT